MSKEAEKNQPGGWGEQRLLSRFACRYDKTFWLIRIFFLRIFGSSHRSGPTKEQQTLVLTSVRLTK